MCSRVLAVSRAAVIALLIFASQTVAQTLSILEGRVLDATGSVISGAAITLRAASQGA